MASASGSDYFHRPVPIAFPILRHFGAAGTIFNWHIDEATGLWKPGRVCANCKKVEPCACLTPEYYGQHRGVDFACPEGTPILAMTDGVVIRTGINPDPTHHDAGLVMVMLVSRVGYDNWFLTYRHITEFCERPTGRMVKAGDRLGYSGYTGPGAPYLHVDLQDLKGQWHPLPIKPQICDGMNCRVYYEPPKGS